MHVKIVDVDNQSSNDLLGEIYLDWRICLLNPGKWAIDKVFHLEGLNRHRSLKVLYLLNGSPATRLGEIYFKVRFLTHGAKDDKDPGFLK